MESGIWSFIDCDGAKDMQWTNRAHANILEYKMSFTHLSLSIDNQDQIFKHHMSERMPE